MAAQSDLVTKKLTGRGQQEARVRPRQRLREQHQLQEHLNLDYLKNMFIFFSSNTSSTKGTAMRKGAMTLEKVLFTVLKANEKDIEIIEKARIF